MLSWPEQGFNGCRRRVRCRTLTMVAYMPFELYIWLTVCSLHIYAPETENSVCTVLMNLFVMCYVGDYPTTCNSSTITSTIPYTTTFWCCITKSCCLFSFPSVAFCFAVKYCSKGMACHIVLVYNLIIIWVYLSSCFQQDNILSLMKRVAAGDSTGLGNKWPFSLNIWTSTDIWWC